MALISCSACGHKISEAATACPQCGHPNQPPPPRPHAKALPSTKSSGCGIVLLILLVLVVFGSILTTCVGPDKPDRQAVKSSPVTPNRTPAEERANWAAELERSTNSAQARLSYARSILGSDKNSPEGIGAQALLPELEAAAEKEKAEIADRLSRGRWTYRTEADSLTGQSYKFAFVDSDNSFEFEFPYQGT